MHFWVLSRNINNTFSIIIIILLWASKWILLWNYLSKDTAFIITSLQQNGKTIKTVLLLDSTQRVLHLSAISFFAEPARSHMANTKAVSPNVSSKQLLTAISGEQHRHHHQTHQQTASTQHLPSGSPDSPTSPGLRLSVLCLPVLSSACGAQESDTPSFTLKWLPGNHLNS